MTPQMVGLVGGAIGGLVGLMGGMIGTYFSVKNTRTSAERRFMLKCAAACWVLTLLLIVAPLPLVMWKVLPNWAYWIGWSAYMAVVLGLLPRLNRRANELGGSSPPAQSS
jgi:hypothetical protein